MGLGISILLFILAMILTWQSSATSCELESMGSPGVLQLTWLMSRASHIPDKLKHVKTPDSNTLLRAGKAVVVDVKQHIGEKASGTKASGVLDAVPDLVDGKGSAGGSHEEEKRPSEV